MSTKKITIQAIKPESIVSISISGFFHKRLISLYFNYASKYEPEKFKELCEIIGKNEIEKITDSKEQVDAYSIQTILSLLNEIEMTFKEAGLINPEEIEVPNVD
jgi:hypothetical protein